MWLPRYLRIAALLLASIFLAYRAGMMVRGVSQAVSYSPALESWTSIGMLGFFWYALGICEAALLVTYGVLRYLTRKVEMQ